MMAGPDDAGSGHLGARLDHDPADDLARGVGGPVQPGLDGLEHEPVDLEHVGDAAGVLPVPGDGGGVHRLALVDEPPIASVISSSFRQEGLSWATASWMAGREHVHADQGQVALRLLGLLLQADDLAAVVELGDAERPRVRHPGQHDLRVRAGGPELLGELR